MNDRSELCDLYPDLDLQDLEDHVQRASDRRSRGRDMTRRRDSIPELPLLVTSRSSSRGQPVKLERMEDLDGEVGGLLPQTIATRMWHGL